jgi:hypothetical protein
MASPAAAKSILCSSDDVAKYFWLRSSIVKEVLPVTNIVVPTETNQESKQMVYLFSVQHTEQMEVIIIWLIMLSKSVI